MNSTLEIPSWAPVIAEEKAAIAAEKKQRKEKQIQDEQEEREKRSGRNMAVSQFLSGVQGTLNLLLKDQSVVEFVQKGFEKREREPAVLFEDGISDPRTAAICILYNREPLGLAIELRDTTRDSLLRGWIVSPNAFYELPETFIAELKKLVDSEYLLRRLVRVLD
ncbi:MAG: hypothetical protein AAB699_01535 [Patescibacteria group bacterium]